MSEPVTDSPVMDSRQFDGTYESYAEIRAWARDPLKDMPEFWKYEPIIMARVDDVVGGKYVGRMQTLTLPGGDVVLPGEWVYRITPARGLPTFRKWYVSHEWYAAQTSASAPKAPEPTPELVALLTPTRSWFDRFLMWFYGVKE